MKTLTRFLGILVTLTLFSLPAIPAMAETAGGELTLADFQRSIGGSGKPTGVWEAYRQYKYRLAHPAPKPVLDVSRMRADAGEKTLADFEREFPKFASASAEYSRYLARKNQPVREYVGPGFVSTGKPSADWWKMRNQQ